MAVRTPEKYVTLKDVARVLSYSERTVRRLMNRGDIPFYRLGGTPRFVLEEVHQAVKRTANKPRRRKRKVAKTPEREYSHPETLSTQDKKGVANGQNL